MLSRVIKYLTYALCVAISGEFIVLCHCEKRFFCRLVRYSNTSEIEKVKVVKYYSNRGNVYELFASVGS